MCGRYSLNTDQQKLKQRFNLSQPLLEFQPRYNIAPSQANIVIVHNGGNKMEFMTWGLIPHWAKEAKLAYSTINARKEGIADKPTYRKAFRSQRCLVPATGFYEWQKPTTRGAKIPYYIHLKNQQIFAFAGLYDIWQSPDQQLLKTYTIVTTEANELMKPIHERMPVILPPESESLWLNDQISQQELLSLLNPFTASLMEAYVVSKAVNNPAFEGANLIEHAEPPPLPAQLFPL